MNKDIDPESLFEALKLSAKHPIKRRNLEALNNLCRSRHDSGSTIFSVADIGRELERAKILTPRSLRQNASADYRALISAWRDRAEKKSIATTKKKRQQTDWLQYIDDPAVRSLAEGMRVKNILLAGKVLELQKLQKTIYFDASTKSEQIVIESRFSTLFITEKKAILTFLDLPALKNEFGLIVNHDGSVSDGDGHIVLPIGFFHAVQKLVK